MNQFIIFISICVVASAFPNDFESEQNKNARYEFQTDVDDHINDLTNKRFEIRDGLKVEGSYSYSDGFVKRTVDYVADENGYRITREEATPLAGPKIDVNGIASIVHKAHGNLLKYSVKSQPISQ